MDFGVICDETELLVVSGRCSGVRDSLKKLKGGLLYKICGKAAVMAEGDQRGMLERRALRIES